MVRGSIVGSTPSNDPVHLFMHNCTRVSFKFHEAGEVGRGVDWEVKGKSC